MAFMAANMAISSWHGVITIYAHVYGMQMYAVQPTNMGVEEQ